MGFVLFAASHFFCCMLGSMHDLFCSRGELAASVWSGCCLSSKVVTERAVCEKLKRVNVIAQV